MTLRRTIMQSNYDSVLDPAEAGRPAKLTIRLKVTLVPLDPSIPWVPLSPGSPPTHLADSLAHVRRGQVLDYNNNPVTCRSWLVPEWNAYKIRFKRAVEHGWNNQLILLPTDSSDPNEVLGDADYRQLISSPNVRAHVQGAIDIALMPMNTAGHALNEVAHLDTPGTTFRVWMHRITDESVQFQTFHDRKHPGWSTGQITVAHEIGHWLRGVNATHFDHIDAEYAKTLPAVQRAKAQYGRTLGRKEALMGDGSRVTEHEARPWLARIRRQTPMKLGWSMMHAIEFRRIMNETTDREKRLMGIRV
jgi:hypothetical protein